MMKALKFATKAHAGQMRKSGDEYISHPISVMEKVKSLGFPKYVQKAALLHDVCEDSDVTKKDIEKAFGKNLGYMVDKLTKEDKEKFSNDEEGQNLRLQRYLKKLESGSKKEPAILFIKMCDQMDNLSSVPVFTEQKYYRKLWETKMYYFPMYQKSVSNIPKKFAKAYQKLLNELQSKVNRLIQSGHQNAQESHDNDQMVERVTQLLSNSKVSF